jgi:DNA-binding HxlR family transcriptional regulator
MELSLLPIGLSENLGANLLNKEDAAIRRPRYRRVAPSERPSFRLQERDREIVSLVHNYRLIPSRHIQRLIDGSDQKILRRLQALFHARYVDRISQGNNSEVLYALDDKGADLLAGIGQIERRRIDWGQKNRELTERFLEHTMMLTDFRAVLTLALRAIPDINISLWLPDGALREEVIVDYRKAPVVPDGYFVVERQGKKAHCFIEADQSTMSGRRFARKLKAYLGWWREGKSRDKLGAEFFRVLTLTKSPERATNLCKIAEEVCKRGEDPNATCLFWFACEEDYRLANPASVLERV